MKNSTLMKFFVMWGWVFMLLLSTTACSDKFDDSDLQKKIADLTTRILELEKQAKTTNTDLKTLQALVETLQGNVYIAKVEQTANGYIIHFTNGEKAEIVNGEPGADAPVIGVKAESDGIYYWTITSAGKTEWLTDALGNKLRAGAVTPQMGVDKEGYWTISFDGGKTVTRILDSNGKPVAAMNGIFSKVEQEGDNLIVTLANGSKITIPIRSDFYMLIKDAPEVARFDYGETKTFAVESVGIDHVVLTKPDEWKVGYQNNMLTITAPAEDHAACADLSGEVSIIYFSTSYLSTSISLKIMIAKVPAEAKNLSADGTANCYIIQPGNLVTFDAQYKGNSTTESIENPASAKLVWQDTKNLISDLYYVASEKKIVVVTGAGASGNAVVAICGDDGKILWSWHLWIADYTPAESLFTTPANTAGTTWTFMDRNIGATTKSPSSFDCHGMIYQWGRKDPFTSAGTFTIINDDYSYQIDGERPIYDISNNELPKIRTLAEYHGTIAKSVQNPMVFFAMTYEHTGKEDEYGEEIVLNDYRTKDWVDVSNDDYWGGVSGKKTVYDPCPVGYKVPTCDANSNTPYAWLIYANMKWDNTNKGCTQDGQWFPATGTRVYASGGLDHQEANSYGGMWIGTAGKASTNVVEYPELYGQYMFIIDGKRTFKVSKDARSQGMSVRCVKE